MKVTNFECRWTPVGGSSFQGYITTTYDKLFEILGSPTFTTGDPEEKVNCEWIVNAETDEGKSIRFTIYNWKTGYTPTEEYEWHVGGYDLDSVDAAHQIIGS